MIDRSGDVWLAKLVDHKTAHKGKERILVFGPKAKLILAKYITLAPGIKLFSCRRDSYGRAVTIACDEAKIARWTPHWLRHNAASRLREEYGLDVAQVIRRAAMRRRLRSEAVAISRMADDPGVDVRRPATLR